MLYEKLDDGRVRCQLCSHRCSIAEGKTGICGVRANRDGMLYTLVYGELVSENVDPIEKKPLFHVYPGSRSFSIATAGCNFRCLHCQNADISQMPRERGRIMGSEVSPEDIVSAARRADCRTIAYTYTEPTIFFEYAVEVAQLAHEADIQNVFVTNGYMTAEALERIHPYLDAANVDLKGFTEAFYRTVCGARLQPVLEALRLMKQMGIWVEVTTLLIPEWNDSEEELRDIAGFIRTLGEETPWHVTAFFPTYRMTDRPRTPISALRRARTIGLEAGLRYVYSGNVPGDEGEDTLCYGCGKVLVDRYGYRIVASHIEAGRCVYCGVEIDGIGL